jgi:hemolysin activation/secretion protein
MAAGKELGTVDVELKAEDKLPFHGSLEVNNRSTHDTSPLRVNGSAHYDNLWGLEHSLSGQYQFSPQNFNEVEVVSASYTLPAPWNRDDSMVVYGIYSNSNTTFGESFSTLGKGDVIGARYIAPLTPFKTYNHTAVFGFDYKHFDENVGTTGGVISTPVEYMPFSIAYSGSRPDSSGLTLLNATFNMAFRGLVSRDQQFQDKRYKARTNYIFANVGVERRQQLPGGASLGMKLDGQIADQPLISNEQYAAGGMESVRGYDDSEMMGDNAFHGTIELVSPNLAPKVGLGEKFKITPYGFYDFAALWVKDPLPGQDKAMDIQGAGAGVRGFLFRDLEYQCDWAYALVATNRIRKGDQRVYFKVKYQF